jgi:magnesium-transporting ATPase (P-type)
MLDSPSHHPDIGQSPVQGIQRRFIEGLMTLGGLLAVFLGFVADKSPSILPIVVLFGTFFILSAFLSYSMVVYFNWENPTLKLRIGIWASSLLLAFTFSGLLSIGLAIALLLAFPSPNRWTSAIEIGFFAVALVGVYLTILKVMELPRPTKDGTRS